MLTSIPQLIKFGHVGSPLNDDVIRVEFYSFILSHILWDAEPGFGETLACDEANIVPSVVERARPLDSIDECRRCARESECRIDFEKRGVISLIHEVGPARNKLLSKASYATIRSIYDAVRDNQVAKVIQTIQDKLTSSWGTSWPSKLPTQVLIRILYRCIAKTENREFLLDPKPLPNRGTFIYRDSEYDPEESWPFCVSAMICRGDSRERIQCFYQSRRQFNDLCRKFEEALVQHLPATMFIWGGQDRELLGIVLT